MAQRVHPTARFISHMGGAGGTPAIARRAKRERPTMQTQCCEQWREITWKIGTAELQRSTMAAETFELLQVGYTHVDMIRDCIRRQRGLIIPRAIGRWADSPSER